MRALAVIALLAIGVGSQWPHCFEQTCRAGTVCVSSPKQFGAPPDCRKGAEGFTKPTCQDCYFTRESRVQRQTLTNPNPNLSAPDDSVAVGTLYGTDTTTAGEFCFNTSTSSVTLRVKGTSLRQVPLRPEDVRLASKLDESYRTVLAKFHVVCQPLSFRLLSPQTWTEVCRVVAVRMWSTPFPPVYDSEMLPATIVVQLTKPTSSAPVGLNLVNGDEASSPPVLVEVRGLAAWSKCHLTSAELRSCA